MKKLPLLICVSSVALTAYIVYSLSFYFPEAVESVYSRGVYPIFAAIGAAITKNIPFSLAEVIFYALIALAVFCVVYLILSAKQPKGKRLYTLAVRLMTIVSFICVFYTVYIFGWALNYARQPLSQSMELDTSAKSPSELKSLCLALAQKANALRSQTETDANGVFALSCGKNYIKENAAELYDAYAPEFIAGRYDTNVKSAATKSLMSALDMQGIFIPYTYEPTVNADMPDLYFPSSVLHEYAHFAGFAREDEANFLSFYVGRNSPNTDVRYSCYAMALSYALTQLKSTDYEAFARVCESVDDGVWLDYAYNNYYWEAFKETGEKMRKVNDSYLKANNQSDGVQSYGRMIDLTLAIYLRDGSI